MVYAKNVNKIMSTVSLTLNEILDLAKKTLLANGCDEENASILADTNYES